MHSDSPSTSRNARASQAAKVGTGPKLVSFALKRQEMQSNITPESLLQKGFHELLGGPPGDECARLALALSMSRDACHSTGKSLCVCVLASEAQERGQLYGHGLAALGIAAERTVVVTAAKEKELRWALDEALISGAFGAVIGALGKEERQSETKSFLSNACYASQKGKQRASPTSGMSNGSLRTTKRCGN